MSLKYTISRICIVFLLILSQVFWVNAQQDRSPKKEKTENKTDKNKQSDKNNTDIVWDKPDRIGAGKSNFVSGNELYEIRLTAISNQKLHQKDIKVYINSKSLDGSKFGEGKIRGSKKPKRGKYSHRYTNKVALKEGANKIEIEVRSNDGKITSYPVTIHYEPKRVNLHILAIGPKHANLQFTAKDAEDFADAFNNQEGRLFKKVNFYRHTTTENTNVTSIQEAFQKLPYLYETDMEEKINDDDLLIIFISSHGQKGNNGKGFKIQTTGYKPMFSNLHTIDYEEDIIKHLKSIHCKKLMFIDACHSGAADGSKGVEEDMAKALYTLLNSDPGLTTITSCQKYEKSYEDAAWKNGAFTEAILAAFANKPFNGNRPDINDNKIIELGELEKYIQAYVPYLVKKEKPDAGTQKPHIVSNQLTADLPIFAIKSYKSQPSYDESFPDPKPGEIIDSKTSANYPFLDNDGDGMSNKIDHCPNHKGLAKNDGCPEAISDEDFEGPLSGNFIDNRDKKMYQWVRLNDGKKWMAQNLNYAVKKESWCFDNKGKNCKSSGRLYTWNASLKACPKGWRLPTAHDWENLINYYGGNQAAYHALLVSGNSNFAVQLGGIRQSDSNFCCEGEFGNYWTSESSASKATYTDFNRQFGEVKNYTYDKNTALSCRCVQE